MIKVDAIQDYTEGWVTVEFPDLLEYERWHELINRIKLRHICNRGELKIHLDSIQFLQYLFNKVPNFAE